MPAAITVLVLNYNQKDLLVRCLDACQRLENDGVSPRVVCIDNGSSDASVDEVRRRFPAVNVLANRKNLGFARAYNAAIAAADTEWVALLNNDTVPEPAWLTAAYAAACRNRAACVGSRMLKDSGARIDYVGATMNFYGHGFHPHFDEPASYRGEERPVIAACGGAMLCRRDVFLEAGGFDEAYYAYFEDLDLCWRMNVLGHEVLYAPDSVVHHEHAATNAVLVPGYQRLAWNERNGLRSVVKNYGEARLGRVLPVALSLCIKRAQLDSAIDPDTYFFENTGRQQPGVRPVVRAGPSSSRLARVRAILGERGPLDGALYVAYRLLGRRFGRPAGLPDGYDAMNRVGYSRIAAIEALTRAPRDLREKRDAVQRARRRSDDSVVKLFVDTFRPSFPHPELKVCQEELVEAFGLRELFPQ
jgi:GT2 family glycosyltransferase